MTSTPVRKDDVVGSTDADERPRARGWARRHRWTLGLAVLAAGAWWWRRRDRRIELTPVSEDWLATHEFESGRRSRD